MRKLDALRCVFFSRTRRLTFCLHLFICIFAVVSECWPSSMLSAAFSFPVHTYILFGDICHHRSLVVRCSLRYAVALPHNFVLPATLTHPFKHAKPNFEFILCSRQRNDARTTKVRKTNFEISCIPFKSNSPVLWRIDDGWARV